MATKLFRIWGHLIRWRPQRGDGYDLTSNLDGICIFYYSGDCDTAECAFYRASRQTVQRRYLPSEASRPRELHIVIATL